MKKKLPTTCPSCQSKLSVKSLICETCDTQVNGNFNLPVLAIMSSEDQDFIIEFVKSSGSLKDMAKQMNLSYPTVRNILDEIIKRLVTKQNSSNNEHD